MRQRGITSVVHGVLHELEADGELGRVALRLVVRVEQGGAPVEGVVVGRVGDAAFEQRHAEPDLDADPFTRRDVGVHHLLRSRDVSRQRVDRLAVARSSECREHACRISAVAHSVTPTADGCGLVDGHDRLLGELTFRSAVAALCFEL